MDVTPAAIDVHIEHLVLHDIAEVDRARFTAAIQGELTRLIARRGLAASMVRRDHVPILDAGTINANPADVPHAVGTRVARSVYEGLKQ